MGFSSKEAMARLMKYVIKHPNNKCWEWTGKHRNFRGYPRIIYNNKRYAAHRLMYRIFYKCTIPSKMCICHTCDNINCINHRHLFLGSVADNNRDKILKGRQPRGDKIGISKLKKKDIPIIRRMYRDGKTQINIASTYKVSRSAIDAVLSGRSWSWV